MIRRQPCSTPLYSSAASVVYKGRPLGCGCFAFGSRPIFCIGVDRGRSLVSDVGVATDAAGTYSCNARLVLENAVRSVSRSQPSTRVLVHGFFGIRNFHRCALHRYLHGDQCWASEARGEVHLHCWRSMYFFCDADGRKIDRSTGQKVYFLDLRFVGHHSNPSNNQSWPCFASPCDSKNLFLHDGYFVPHGSCLFYHS